MPHKSTKNTLKKLVRIRIRSRTINLSTKHGDPFPKSQPRTREPNLVVAWEPLPGQHSKPCYNLHVTCRPQPSPKPSWWEQTPCSSREFTYGTTQLGRVHHFIGCDVLALDSHGGWNFIVVDGCDCDFLVCQEWCFSFPRASLFF